MSLMAVLLGGWVVFMALRGWFRGFWPMLGGVLGLLAAYVLALWLAPSTAPSLQKLGVPPAFSYGVAAIAIWCITAFLFSLMFRLLSSPLARRQGRLGNVGGAVMGMAFGVVTGLFAVWGFSVTRDLLSDQFTAIDTPAPTELEGVAASFVSRLTEAGMSFAGASDALTDLTSAAMRQPAKLVQSARELARTPALQDLMADPEAQRLMRNNDQRGLQETAAFKKVLATPEAQSLFATLANSSDHTVDYARDKLAQISIKVQQMRDDPEVVALAQDPEVVALVDQQNPWKILTHPKIQKLWTLMSREQTTVGFTDGKITISQKADQPDAAEPIYKWRDDEGRVHYTDRRAIPASKLENAQQISR